MATDPDQTIKEDADLYNRVAASYGSDTDLLHAIPREAEELYRQDIEEVLGPLAKYQAVLEVGAGNGVFTRLLKQWGCGRIVGTDISAGMLALARKRLPDCRFEQVTSETDAALFKPMSFDLVISRQLVCHLIDPIAVFSIWKDWLKPGGRVAVIDGLWTRRDWGPPNSPAGALVDNRPLSCTQTWATVSYLLRRAGFSVLAEGFLSRVNGFARERYAIGEAREPVFRFVVVAAAAPACPSFRARRYRPKPTTR